MASYDAHRMLVTGWGDQVALDDVGLYWVSLPLMTAISELRDRVEEVHPFMVRS